MLRDKRQIIKLIFLSAVFLLPQLVFSAASSDAIATRVIPNPNHLSVFNWYKKQSFAGSPQALTVDGYEAVRDGRTVYVNAANIDLKNKYCSNNQSTACSTDSNCGAGNTCLPKFYTNIYLLSFNQNVKQATQDIFRQLLAHWKFNTNIPPENKDNVRRDTKRLADLAEIKSTLDNYQRNHHGDFPSLAAGSYISGKSLSVWPSWQATLAKELEITLPFDPINKLGICSTDESENKKYDPVTCWDQRNKIFAGVPVEPVVSRVYMYTYIGKAAYNICALMQSGYLTTLAQGACSGSAVGYKVTCEDTVWTPNPATICSDKKINQTSNCDHIREVNGTKCCDKVWTPNTALNLVCSNQTVTETSDCGRTRNITHGTKTDGACCTPTSPNCAASTCAGQTCNTGCATVNGAKTDGACCVPTNPSCTAASTCAGQTCNTGCATVNGAKTDGACCIPTNPSCTAANTCVGQTCNTGCATVNGAKTDGACCTPTNPNCAANTCVGQTCNTGCATVTGAKTDGACARFTLSGNVKEALTGLNVKNVLVSAQTQAGVEVKNAATDSSGNFTIPFLTSNSDYKIIITKAGYKPGGILHYVFDSDKTVQLYLLPDTFVGLAAIVLRWERTATNDLDAHLKFSAAGTDYHVYHSVKDAGGSSLDLDTRISPGQETITIRSAEAGVEYSYYVKAYGDLIVNQGNKTFNPTVKVQLFDELGMLISEFTGKSSSETLWHVFKFTPSIGASSLVFEDIYNTPPPPIVPLPGK